MTSADLGTKRVCPKCDAKFYDFGATDPVKCPKCGKEWREGAKKKTTKPKKEIKPAAVRIDRREDDLPDVPGDLPEVEDDATLEELEPMEDETVELTSLEEVEEHEEEEEADPNSDDAEDEMFTEMPGQEKLVDDLEQYLDKDEEEEDGEEE